MTVADFTSILNQLLPEPHAGLLNGILFGTKATLSKDFIVALTTTGTLHIVALSGMNITILGTLVDLALLRLVSRRIASVLTVMIIIGFVWFVGPSASVIRAAIMGCLALISVIFGRQAWSLLSFILTVGIMLLVKPDWTFDLSFQLSALATLGIILFGNSKMGPAALISRPTSSPMPSTDLSHLDDHTHTQKSFPPSFLVKGFGRSTGDPLRASPTSEQRAAFWAGCKRIAVPSKMTDSATKTFLIFIHSLIADDLRITLAAQVFTIPLILLTFHRISLVSPLTNILIGWIIPPLTALGMAVAILGWIFLPLGQIVAWVSWLMLQYLIFVIELTAKIPLASIGF